MSKKSLNFELACVDGISKNTDFIVEHTGNNNDTSDIFVTDKDKSFYVECKMTKTTQMASPRIYFNKTYWTNKKLELGESNPLAQYMCDMLNSNEEVKCLLSEMREYFDTDELIFPSRVYPPSLVKNFFKKKETQYILDVSMNDIGKIIAQHYLKGKKFSTQYIQIGDNFYKFCTNDICGLRDVPILSGEGYLKVRVSIRSKYVEVQPELKFINLEDSNFSILNDSKKQFPFMKGGVMIRHPAKYSDSLMPIFDEILPKEGKILDCFAGTGKLRTVREDAILLELEPEWANISGAIVGDATNMPFEDCSFDAVCTSPTYGNRMADAFIDHKPEKNYKRNTYTHCLGRNLSDNNSGKLQWGKAYRELHEKAWNEVYRVLKPSGMFVLNISDHIRKGVVVEVSNWHKEFILSLGFVLKKHIKVETPRYRFGQNSEVRVEHENVFVFEKP